jgi:pyruvate dehydrogenase E2 component (dihydrolipoamide acetyltransferase)
MATPVIMPRQGQSVESCIISKWHKKKGDNVRAGDILFTYETDKATFEEEAKVDGTILEIFFDEGDDIPVLTNVCVIGTEGESTSEFDPRLKSDTEDEKPEEIEEVKDKAVVEEEVVSAEPGQKDDEGRVKVSPRARNLAERIGVDFRGVNATGPYGRIIERDIIEAQNSGHIFTPSAKAEYEKTAISGLVAGTGLGGRITTEDLKNIPFAEKIPTDTSEADYVEVKLPNIRKVIAKAMHHSLSSTAQLTLNTSFDASDMLAFRKKIKEYREKLGFANITINDMILYAVSRSILNHKELNAYFLDDKMTIFNNVHLGIAVDTERGLMVPTLFNANRKSLNEISQEAKALAESCQKGTISPDALKGASFTVTNLGALGIESFTPVLNPPQVGILGVNTIVQRVKQVNDEYVYYPAMALSLTFDHRAVDGAPAARFLKELKTNLENFSLLMAR